MILTQKKYIRLLRRSLLNKTFLILFLLFNSTSYSQVSFSAGPVLGIQGSQLSGDTYAGYNKPGLYAGLFANWSSKDDYSWQFEIAFSQKGARHIPNPGKGDYTSYDLRLNYIEIPFFWRPHFKGFTFDVGLSYGRLLGYSEYDQNGVRNPVRSFRKSEFAGLISAGYKWGDHFIFSVRATRSLFPVRDHQSAQYFWWNPGQMNSVLSFNLCYILL